MSIASRVVPAMSETITRSSPRTGSRATTCRCSGGRSPPAARRPRRPRARARVAPAPRSLGRAGPRCRAPAPPTPPPGRRARARRTRPRRGSLRAVDLVCGHDHRHVAAAQLARQLGVARAQPGARVDGQHDHRRLGDRLARLGLNRRASASRPPGRRRRCRPAERRPFHSASISLRSRVTPACSWTTASRLPDRRLTSVDLPTFGIADDRDLRSAITRAARGPARDPADDLLDAEPVVSSSIAPGAARAASARACGPARRAASGRAAPCSSRRRARRRAGARAPRGRRSGRPSARRQERRPCRCRGPRRPSRRRAISSRCLARRARRARPGPWRPATRASDTSGVRMSVTSRPSSRTRSSSSMSTLATRSAGAPPLRSTAKRDRAVHRPRVEVGEAERVRDARAQQCSCRPRRVRRSRRPWRSGLTRGSSPSSARRSDSKPGYETGGARPCPSTSTPSCATPGRRPRRASPSGGRRASRSCRRAARRSALHDEAVVGRLDVGAQPRAGRRPRPRSGRTPSRAAPRRRARSSRPRRSTPSSATSGSSSIASGTSSASTTVPSSGACGDVDLADRLLGGAPLARAGSRSPSTTAPMRCGDPEERRPRPVERRRRSSTIREPGTMHAAATKNAADDGSPGTSTSLELELVDLASTMTVSPSRSNGTPARSEDALGVVAARLRLGDPRRRRRRACRRSARTT